MCWQNTFCIEKEDILSWESHFNLFEASPTYANSFYKFILAFPPFLFWRVTREGSIRMYLYLYSQHMTQSFPSPSPHIIIYIVYFCPLGEFRTCYPLFSLFKNIKNQPANIQFIFCNYYQEKKKTTTLKKYIRGLFNINHVMFLPTFKPPDNPLLGVCDQESTTQDSITTTV